MTSDGFYARHAGTQGGAAGLGIPLLLRAAAALQCHGASLQLADLLPLGALITALRARSMVPVSVVHTDLPTNDWATLFRVLDSDPRSYLRHHADVYASVVGRSFYERLFPPDSLSIAWTSSALHWLSRAPGPIPDHFFVHRSADPGVQDAYRRQSVSDWTTFLAHRSQELRPGGALVWVDVLRREDETMGAEALFDCLETALRAARDAGTITPAEYAAMVYPTWFRSLEEFRAPFAPEVAGPSGGTLHLEELEPVELPDPFLESWRTSGDADAYGRAQSAFLQGFLEPSFQAALKTRPPEVARDILSSLFSDIARRIAQDPQAVSPQYHLVRGRVTRRG
ncbi:MAG: SAM-dependent methyltransferase [Verrucomicrobia bacterium]|nr:SAM-dependent methyltransferase [Verrucomicrobiota bacterium]